MGDGGNKGVAAELLTDGTSLVLLHGAIGSGKTRLLGKLLPCLEAEETVDVYSLSAEGLTSPEEFWCLVAKTVGAGSNSMNPGDCQLAVNLWANRLSVPAVVLVDQYESVVSPGLDIALADLLEASANLQLVVASRSFDVLTGPMVMARVKTVALEVEEAVHFADADLADADLGDADLGDADLGGAGSAEGSQDFLGDLDQTEAAVLQALSVLGPVVPRLLCETLGRDYSDCSKLLGQLERKGLVRRLRGGEETRFAAAEAVASAWGGKDSPLGKERAATLRGTHAEHLAVEDPVSALQMLLGLGDLAAADKVAHRSFSTLSGAGPQLRETMETLSPSQLEDLPSLFGLYGFLALQGQMPGGPELHKLAQSLKAGLLNLSTAKPKPGRPAGSELPVDMQALLMAAERVLGKWDEALFHARDLERKISEHDHRPQVRQGPYLASVAPGSTRQGGDEAALRPRFPGQSGIALLCSQIALTAMLGGEIDLAKRCATRSFTEAGHSGDQKSKIRAGFRLALLNSLDPAVRRGEHFLEQAEELQRASGYEPEPEANIPGQIAAALNQYGRGNAEAAREIVESLATHIAQSEVSPLALLTLTRVVAYLDGPAEALRVLRQQVRQMEYFPKVSPFMSQAISSHAADLAACSGDVVVAREILEAKMKENDGALLHASQARLALLLGDATAAVASLQRALNLNRTHIAGTDVQLLAATIWFAAGDSVRAFQELDRLAPTLVGSPVGALASGIPFEPLKNLAVAARDAGHADVVRYIETLPEKLRPSIKEPLSIAEQRSLHAVVATNTIGEAAEKLTLSPNTIKYHLRAIYRKLGVGNKEDAVRAATRLGLLKEASDDECCDLAGG